MMTTTKHTLTAEGGLLSGPWSMREAILAVADEVERLIADHNDRGETEAAADLWPIAQTLGELAARA